MSKKTWEKSWGKLMPLLQTKTENLTQNKILDQKISHGISQILATEADINDKSPIVQCTFLHLCIGKGLLQSSKLLITKGSKTDIPNLFHETAQDYIRLAPYNKKALEQLFSVPKKIFQINKKSR